MTRRGFLLAAAVGCVLSGLVLTGRLDALAPRSPTLAVLLVACSACALAGLQLAVATALRGGTDPGRAASAVMTGVSLTVLVFTLATLVGRGARAALGEGLGPVAVGAGRVVVAVALGVAAWRTTRHLRAPLRAVCVAAALATGTLLGPTDVAVVAVAAVLGTVTTSSRAAVHAPAVRTALLAVSLVLAVACAALLPGETAASGAAAVVMAATACGAQVHALRQIPVRHRVPGDRPTWAAPASERRVAS